MGNPSGFGLRIDKSPGNEVTRQLISAPTSYLSAAFQFPGGKTGNAGGAFLVDTNTTTVRTFLTPGWHTQPVSLEIWFKPANLSPTPTNGQILFEDGGGTGLGLFLSSNGLQARKAAGAGLITYNLATDPNNLLSGPATDEFIQTVVTYNTAVGVLQLFVNGALIGSVTPGGGSWTGGDPAGFGTRGGSNTGGIGTGQAITESFQGQIALIRAYRNRVLTAEEVEQNYLATIAADNTAPGVARFEPATGATGVYPRIENITAIFDEPIQLTGEGTVTIQNLADNSDVVINLPNASVTADGARLEITLQSNLDFQTQYAIQISGDAVSDLNENPFSGIDDAMTWTFTTAEENLVPPVLVTKNPADEATRVVLNTSITATFDQNVVLNAMGAPAGVITLRNLTNQSQTLISTSDASQVMVSGNTLTITPATLLNPNCDYAVQISSDAVRNFSEVSFAGINDDTTWNFTTIPIITGVTVEAFSSQLISGFNRRAEYVVDGSGFEINGPGTHSVVPDGLMWLSNGTFREPNDLIGPFPNSYIEFNLGGNYNLSNVTVWNYNEATNGLSTRGAKDVTISVASSVDGTFRSLGNFVLDQAPGSASVDFGQVIDLSSLGANNVRLIRFDITSNHNGDANFVGLSEVRFEGSISDGFGSGTYLGWIGGFPGVSDSNPSLDFDGGGLPSGIEWIVGGDPSDPTDDAGLAPTVTTDGTYLVFSYQCTEDAKNDPNTSIVVQYAPDLGLWTDATNGSDGILISESDTSPIVNVEVKIPLTLAAPGTTLFARLKAVVTLP